jgi:hypothetical protein
MKALEELLLYALALFVACLATAFFLAQIGLLS